MIRCGAAVLLVATVDAHNCGYRSWSHSDLKRDPQQTRRGISALSDEWFPLRMKFILDETDSCIKSGQKVLNGKATCTQLDVLTKDKRETLKRVMSSAAGWISEIFSIRASERPSSKLKLSQGMCYGIQIPTCASTEGIKDTDYVSIVTVVPDSPGESTNGWAIPCREDQFGRRIAGRINISPSMISWDTISLSNSSTPIEQRVYHDYSYTAIHEIFHTLGFNPSDFASPRRSGWYRNVPATTPITKTEDGVTYVMTPTAIKKARELNNNSAACIHGVPLTRSGGAGTRNSHWDYSFMGHEVMASGGVGYVPVSISSVTLGFFEDTGFFKINYDKINISPKYVWNQDKPNSCSLDMKKPSESLTCSGAGFCNKQELDIKAACSADLTGIAYCFRDGFSGCGNTKGSNSLCVEIDSYPGTHLYPRCFIVGNKPLCKSIITCTDTYYEVQTGPHHSETEKCYRNSLNQIVGQNIKCQPHDKVCSGWTGKEEQLKDQNVSNFFVKIPSTCSTPEPLKTKQGCDCQVYWETATDHCSSSCCKFSGDTAPWCYVVEPDCEGGRTYGYCTGSDFAYKRLLIGAIALISFLYLSYSVYDYCTQVKKPKKSKDVEGEADDSGTIMGEQSNSDRVAEDQTAIPTGSVNVISDEQELENV